ncbi:MAG TPA: cobalt ECF transporter T component CbiQ, partial [Candidatus Altiarchaeales archaeon]|nr:cobalt ECF transporter T component CbiQ [Candidatus Altiarchaeales archaeon]
RVKIISLIFFIFIVISTPPEDSVKFVFYFFLIFALILISKVPLGFILKRSLVIIPFVLLVAISIPFIKEGEIAGSYSIGSLNLNVSYSGIEIFFNVVVKSSISILSMITLVSTTRHGELLKGFQSLKMPRTMIMIMSFMYRYAFILLDEIMRMKTARDSRSCGGNRRWHIRSAGNIIGSLFLRSYGRGERVYTAMLSRGFAGRIRTMDNFRIRPVDVAFVVVFFFIISIIWIS